MSSSKEKAYCKATSRAISSVNANLPLQQTLKAIVRSTAVAMKTRVSILTYDSSTRRLIHRANWGLPHAYLHKGILTADASLGELSTGEPVIVADIDSDKRVQYPEHAHSAGISSIAGVPIVSSGSFLGCLRVYAKEPYDFSSRDINFLKTMAGISGLALYVESVATEKHTAEEKVEGVLPALKESQISNFAHPSEREFADILDFYHVDWVYEPRSFILKRAGDKVIEMFTPDFYLPELDLYVELTTLKQRLVTEKNRKLKRLRELYPEVKITLLYKKDFDRLLAKYGHGPLAQTRSHDIKGILYSEKEIIEKVKSLAEKISADYASSRPVMVGIQRGFLCFMADLMRHVVVPLDIDFMAISNYGGDRSTIKITRDLDLNITERHVLIVEDIIDTGMTLSFLLKHLEAKRPASIKVCTLFNRPARRIAHIPLDYVGFQIPDEFIVGYGLDYQEEYRNLPYVGVVKPESSIKTTT